MSSYRRRLLLANQTEENLHLYGNSAQDKAPTPDNPIDIISLENPTIKINGSNLFNNDFSLIKKVDFLSTNNTARSHYGYEIILPIGTYTIKAYQKSNFVAPVYIYGSLVSANYSSKQTVNTVANSEFRTVTFTVENGDKLLIFDGYDANASTQAHAESFFSMVDIMLNKGTEALPFEPYEEELIEVEGYTLRGVGECRDRIYTYDNKVWYEQNLGAVSLKDIKWVSSTVEENVVYSLFPDMKKAHFSKIGLCNIYAMHPETYSMTNDNAVALGRGNNNYVYIKDTAHAISSSAFNSWIQTIDSELVYQFATPIVTEITGTLAEKILAIDKIKNITVTSSNGVSGSVEVIEE